jgi:hypothetical protein
MIYARGRNVNVSAVAFIVFPPGRLLRLFTIGHSNNFNCAFYSPIMAVE